MKIFTRSYSMYLTGIIQVIAIGSCIQIATGYKPPENNKMNSLDYFKGLSLRNAITSDKDACHLHPQLIKEIRSYQTVVNRIISAVVNATRSGYVYKALTKFIKTFGYRYTGTKNLEESIDYLQLLFFNHSLEYVHTEPVSVPYWRRGKESAEMLYPSYKQLPILGLGGSVSTPPDGIIAEVIVIASFYELKTKAKQVSRKIVVFNAKFESYENTVKYRNLGASEAAKYGAVAVLVKSVTSVSIQLPHAGQQYYEPGVKKIPVASITVETAEMLQELADSGRPIVIKLYMGSITVENRLSRNLVGDFRGFSKPNKVVVVSGHTDSWDVGSGVMDDGAGVFVTSYSVFLLKALGLQPKRTVRAVMWTGEEQGFFGVKNYIQMHANELNNFDLVIESDDGTFTPYGLEFVGSKHAACIMQEITKLMTPLNSTEFKVNNKTLGSDLSKLVKQGIPGAVVANRNYRYNWYHHTEADTMDIINSDDLDKNVAMIAAISYVVADLSVDLPRK